MGAEWVHQSLDNLRHRISLVVQIGGGGFFFGYKGLDDLFKKLRSMIYYSQLPYEQVPSVPLQTVISIASFQHSVSPPPHSREGKDKIHTGIPVGSKLSTILLSYLSNGSPISTSPASSCSASIFFSSTLALT